MIIMYRPTINWANLTCMFSGITEAGSITRSIDFGSKGSLTWSLLSWQIHTREVLLFALIQTNGRQYARFAISISCFKTEKTSSFTWSVSEFKLFKWTLQIQDNFVLHYEMLEKRPALPQHWQVVFTLKNLQFFLMFLSCRKACF